MERAFGVGGGARREENPAHGRCFGPGRGARACGEICDIAIGKLAIAHEHIAVGQPGGDRPRHVGIGEFTPAGRNDQPTGSRLLRDEVHLALAIQGKQGGLHGAEPCKAGHEHVGLDPGRQLPADRGPRPDAQRVESGRRSLRALTQGAEGELPTAFVEQHHPVRARRGAALDEFPEGVARNPVDTVDLGFSGSNRVSSRSHD